MRQLNQKKVEDMKKFLAMILVLSTMFLIVSCGCQEQNPEDEGNGENQPSGGGAEYGDYDGNGTTDEIEQTPIIPLFPNK